MRAAGFVLTGGKSSRMGRDKALLSVGDRHLVEEIAATLSRVTEDVTLIGEPDRYRHLPWRCVPDLHSGNGPLAGIETALTISRTELNLIVACDMPGIQADFLAVLVNAANLSNRLCVAAQDAEGKLHPLCAVYRSACLPAVREALSRSRLKLTSFLQEINAEPISAQGSGPSLLSNVNTPEEWAQWQASRALPK